MSIAQTRMIGLAIAMVGGGLAYLADSSDGQFFLGIPAILFAIEYVMSFKKEVKKEG